MRERDLEELLEGAAEAAVMIARGGIVTYANPVAERLLGWNGKKLRGMACARVLNAVLKDTTPVCGEECPVLQQAMNGVSAPAFDAEVKLKSGERRWLNVSTLAARCGDEHVCVHLMRDVDRQVKIQRAAERMVEELEQSGEPTRPVFPELTEQERRILEHLSLGHTTRQMAEALGISGTTVRNHVQHLMQKLNVHSRIEAVLRGSNRLIRPWEG